MRFQAEMVEDRGTQQLEQVVRLIDLQYEVTSPAVGNAPLTWTRPEASNIWICAPNAIRTRLISASSVIVG